MADSEHPPPNPDSATRARILDVAEQLFGERGYNSVRLRDIADQLGIKHAALYYHFPQKKEGLFVEVMTRSFNRHRAGMDAAIAQAGPDLRAQLLAVAAWLFDQPPVNMGRIMYSDLAAISAANATAISLHMFDALRLPVETALEATQTAGITAVPDPGLAAISFVSLIETVHIVPALGNPAAKMQVIENTVDMLLQGWLKR
ncbi:MAG: TetR/AcrR family transcriptional regulator [Chloroflexi bacterium]|nr:TetR/AcrR family transcriptional regulator [Chloroflexota bacterium]